MSFGGFIRRNIYWSVDFIKGSPIRSHYRDIQNILNNNKSGSEIQKKYLANLIEHAVTNSDLYKSFEKKDINEFPILNREKLISNKTRILVDTRKIPSHKGNLNIQRTSGSTGIPLLVPQDRRKRKRVLAELKFFGDNAGYRSHEKMLQIRIWNSFRKKSKYKSFTENIFPFDCSVINESSFIRLSSLVKKKRIKVFLAYAGWLDELVKYCEQKPMGLKSLKTIISGAELLQEPMRQKLIDTFNCDVVSRYSTQEHGILGQEPISEKYYLLNHASYYFEILKLDSDEKAKFGELGRIVVTDLFNYAFPIIRYDTGDIGIIKKSTSLSNGYNILTEIYGRKFNLIYKTDGTPIHPMSISVTLKFFPEIDQWQLIQKSSKQFILNIRTAKNVTGNIKTCLQKILGNDANIIINNVNEIPAFKSGKKRPIICELVE